MKTIKYIVLTVVLLLTASSTFAQNVNLNENEKKELQIKARQKIEDFQGFLADIASKSTSQTIKDASTAGALKLFIGNGERYQYTDNYNNRVWHDAVIMQVSSKYRPTTSQPMKKYLNRMRYLTYTKVVIENADVVRVDNITKTADGKYEAMAYFSQKFCGFRDGS